MAKKHSVRRIKFKFKPGQRLTDNSPYEIIDREGGQKSDKDGFARAINEGGAGVVYRALYKNMERAIKILNPQDVGEQQDLWDLFRQTFDQEILLLSKLTHTYIAKLMDYGEALIEGKEYNYYVMDYVPGKNFNRIWSSCRMMDFLRLWHEVLSALKYLHANGVMHMDVKGDNIIIRKVGNTLSATLVDLGVSKVIEGEKKLLDERRISGMTYVFSTQEITRPERQRYLSQSVHRSELKSWFPDHDLYACGKILEKALQNKKLYQAISEEGGISCLLGLGRIRDRLLGSTEGQYSSACELQNDFEKLSPGYLSPLGIPEMSLAANVKKNIALPGARVALTERIHEVVDNPLFQRLRNIPQLDFAYLLYPGAKHTRFLHSLYTFHLAREYISHLLDESSFRLMVRLLQNE